MHRPRRTFARLDAVLTLALAAPAVCAAVLCAPGQACAQQQPSGGDDQRAREEFFSGRDLFNGGNYAEAVEHFQRAYQLSHRPQLLYNIGTSFDRLHRWQEARDAFDRFQRELPAAPEHAEVEARLRVIRDEIAQEQRRDEELRRERERATQATAAAANRPVIVVRDPPRPWRYAGYVTGGLAIVSLLAGASVASFGTLQYNSARNDCGMQGTCPDSVVSGLYLESVLSQGLLINGGALLVIAGASLVIDSQRPRPAAHPSDARPPVARVFPSMTVTPGAGGHASGATFNFSLVGAF